MLRRPSLGTMPIVAALVALSMTSGCSFAFVQPPRDEYPSPGGIMNCTTSPAAPVVDTLLTLTNLFSVFYVANQDNVANKGTAVGVGLSVAAIWLSSAIYGYYNTRECADLSREDEEPYHRPVHYGHTGYRPPPMAPPPPLSPPPPPPTDPESGQPRVPQQHDDNEGP